MIIQENRSVTRGSMSRIERLIRVDIVRYVELAHGQNVWGGNIHTQSNSSGAKS